MTENEFERQAEITIRRYLAIRKALGSQVSSEAAALLTLATHLDHLMTWLAKPFDVAAICGNVNPLYSGVKCTRERGHTGGHHYAVPENPASSFMWEDVTVPINYVKPANYRCDNCGVSIMFATPPTNPDIETRCPKCQSLMVHVVTT